MARARYLKDPIRALLHALGAFEVEETAAYAHEDELYAPSGRAWGRRLHTWSSPWRVKDRDVA
jgi:hypothetical protein